MARKRASLKGKGISILLGEEETEDSPSPPTTVVEMPLEAGEGAPPEAHSPEEEAVDRPATLGDEVAATEPPAEEVGPPSLPDIEHHYPEEEPIAPEPELPTVEEPTVVEPGPPSAGLVAPPTPVSAEPPPEAEGPKEVDWSAMLEDEVTTALPSAEEVAAPSVPVIEYYYPEEEPTVPEPELLAIEEIEEAAILEPSPPPAIPVVLPTPPPSPAATQPPPSVPASPPRVRIGGLLAGMSLTDMEKLAPPGPWVEEVKVRETTKAPPKELTEEEKDIVIERVSKKQRRELFELTTKLYREVSKKLAASRLRAKREEALLLLSEARDIALEDPRQFDEAEHKVWQVEAIIANAEDVEKWSHYYGNRLIVYLTAWFVFLITGIVFFNPLSVWLEGITSAAAGKTPPITVPPLLFTMLWGGIGGVVGGLYSLWRHIAEFDKQYTIWYTLQPISGFVMGGIVHVIVMTGFLSMSIQASGTNTIQGSQAIQWFPALLAVVAGFRQNFAYALIHRFIELLGREPEDNRQAGENV